MSEEMKVNEVQTEETMADYEDHFDDFVDLFLHQDFLYLILKIWKHFY